MPSARKSRTALAPATTTPVRAAASIEPAGTGSTRRRPWRQHWTSVSGAIRRVAAAALPPLTELVLTGDGRDPDQGTFFITWAEVEADGATGWILLWSLVYLGAPRDPEGEGAERVRATDPSAGPVSEVVYDVVPAEKYGDDAAAGGRYTVVGRLVPVSEPPATGFGASSAYELVSVEVRSLCTRGVDRSSGACV